MENVCLSQNKISTHFATIPVSRRPIMPHALYNHILPFISSSPTAALVIFWSTPIRDAWIGVVFAHLFMDSLTMMGVPLLDAA